MVLLTSLTRTFSIQFRNSLDFLVRETSGNLNDKMVMVEDVLLSIRKNIVIVDYLTENSPKTTSVEEQFQNCVNIYSDKNTENVDTCFLERVYLFDKYGDFQNCSYYLPQKIIQNDLDQYYKELNKKFNNSGRDVEFYDNDNYIDLAYVLYSDNMTKMGTIFFTINKDSFSNITKEMNAYSDSFWFVFNKYNEVMAENNLQLEQKQIEDIMETYNTNIYTKTLQDTSYLIYTQHMSMGFNCTLAVPENHLFQMLLESIRSYIYIMLFIIAGITGIAFLLIYKMTLPLKEVANSLQSVVDGVYTVKLPDFNSYEFANISRTFNTMIEKINYLINDVYKKKLLIKESELKLLQSRINPHFMFNVLNTIALKARMDRNEEVYKMVTSFASLIQARVYRDENEMISLKQELNYVNFYLYLQSYRFGDTLEYLIQCEDDSLMECYIPKLCLQFIVENAVVHGIEPKGEKGCVTLSVTRDADIVLIEIIDDGVGFDTDLDNAVPPEPAPAESGEHNRIALYNVYRLLMYYYGEPYGIHIFSKRGIGTKVVVKIPFNKEGKRNV